MLRYDLIDSPFVHKNNSAVGALLAIGSGPVAAKGGDLMPHPVRAAAIQRAQESVQALCLLAFVRYRYNDAKPLTHHGEYSASRTWTGFQLGLPPNAVQPAPPGTGFHNPTQASWPEGYNGADLIEGGAAPAVSQTVMRGNGGDDRIFAAVEQSLGSAIQDGEEQPGLASSNYLIDGGAGNDQIVGSAGARNLTAFACTT